METYNSLRFLRRNSSQGIDPESWLDPKWLDGNEYHKDKRNINDTYRIEIFERWLMSEKKPKGNWQYWMILKEREKRWEKEE